MSKILILGATGLFGGMIAHSLAKQQFSLILASRDHLALEKLFAVYLSEGLSSNVEIAVLDIMSLDFKAKLKNLNPKLVINTCGPFQWRDYNVAQVCIELGIHYLDIADAREFVRDFCSLNEKAKANNVLAVTGASTVPGLSSAVIEHYREYFSEINNLQYGINPGQKTPRGLATTKSILTYLGKPIKPYKGNEKKLYGWQDIFREEYPGLGKRWMANCDIPDLDLFFSHYGIQQLHFSAGMETSALHLSMYCLSWLVRAGLPVNLSKYAKPLLALSHCFDFLGTDAGGMHMIFQGKDKQNKPLKLKWYIIVRKGDGPNVPTIPAIVLAKKIMRNEIIQIGRNSIDTNKTEASNVELNKTEMNKIDTHKIIDMRNREKYLTGAMPCLGLVSLKEYLKELSPFAVETFEEWL